MCRPEAGAGRQADQPSSLGSASLAGEWGSLLVTVLTQLTPGGLGKSVLKAHENPNLKGAMGVEGINVSKERKRSRHWP